MKAIRARITVLTALAVIAALGVAACGSSSSTSSTSTAAAAAGGAAGGGAGGGAGPGNSAARAKLAACLKQHGVTLPSRPAGAGGGTGGTGSGTQTTGSGTATTGGGAGGYGTGRRRGFFGGGGGQFANPKFRAALQACGGAAGFRRGAGGAGGRFRPTQAAITKFAACVKQHGYTLPKANLTGKGPIYPTKIEADKKFQTAASACQSLLRPAGGTPPGGSPPAGSTSTSGA